MTVASSGTPIELRGVRVLNSQSSAADLGLQIDDIVTRQGAVRSSSERAVRLEGASSAERAFNALADAKRWTSQVAMHMEIATRDRYFRQLDRLHDVEEWIGDEQPVGLSSYQGFVRFMLRYGGKSKPALALSPRGRLVAIWDQDDRRLTVEFIDKDTVQWIVSQSVNDRTERAAGLTALERLTKNLQPYTPQSWDLLV